MRTCPFCQAVNQDDSRFCFRCGNAFPANVPPPAPVPVPGKKRESNKTIIAIVIAVLAFLLVAGGVIGVLAWRSYVRKHADPGVIEPDPSEATAVVTTAEPGTASATSAPATASTTTSTTVPATAAPTTAAGLDTNVRVGEYGLYDVNIFLSNFIEVGLRNNLNAFALSGNYAEFVMRHNYINARDYMFFAQASAVLPGDIMRNNTNYFFRRTVPDGWSGNVTYNEQQDHYSILLREMSDITRGECRALAVSKGVDGRDGNSVRVVYGVFDSDSDVSGMYGLTYDQAMANPSLRFSGDDSVWLSSDQTGLYVISQNY